MSRTIKPKIEHSKTVNAPSLKSRVVEVLHLEPEKLKANPNNPRKHGPAQRAALRAVLAEIGFAGALLARRNGEELELIDGHLRVEELPKGEKVPVVVVDLSETEARKLAAVYDPIAGMAATDYEALGRLLDGITHDSQALRDIVNELGAGAPDTSSNDAPGAQMELADELQRKWKVQAGDVWEIGRHRLLCGDSTDSNTVTAFAEHWQADSLVTDPPYGVDYGEKTEHLSRHRSGRARANIQNDSELNYRQFFTAFLTNAPLASRNTAYVFMSSQELHTLRLAIEDAGFTWGDYLIWVKDSLVLGRKDYNARHEFLVYGWKGRHKFFGPKNATTILEFDRPRVSKEHPTMKPVDLVGRIIQDGTPIRGKVYEPFSGSGTTLVASEQTGRECRAIELEPKYCAVALERLTGMGLEAKRG